MRFRNLVKDKKTGNLAPIYFPYAGDKDKRGREVAAGALSRELPPQRFFDPLLQRDWKMGAIEVLFNEQDKVVLGDAIKGLVGEDVEVQENAVPVTTARELVVVSQPAGAGRKRGRPKKTEVTVRTVVEQAPVAVPSAEPVTEGTIVTQPDAEIEIPAPVADVQVPLPVPALPELPKPELAPAQVPQPVAAPRIGKHTVHASADVMNKTGIQNMKNMPPAQFAGFPAGIGLADLKRQNSGLPSRPKAS